MTDGHPGAFEADLDAAAAVGLSVESFSYLTANHFGPGQLAEFTELDHPMKVFVLKVLAEESTEADWGWFNEQDDCKAVADWMLRLPGVRRTAGGSCHGD